MAIYIIKPEAIRYADAIRSHVETHSPLIISRTVLITLDNEAVEHLFADDKETPLIEAIKAHMLGKQVVLAIVTAKGMSEEQTAEALIKVTGKHFDPRLCEPNTVRAKFGSASYRIYHNQRYFLNAVHRSSPNESDLATAWAHKIIDSIYTN